LQDYRQRSYRELVDLIEGHDTMRVRGSSGVEYQLDVQVLWDNRPHGPIRVVGAIDDFCGRTYVPVSESFVVKQNDNRP